VAAYDIAGSWLTGVAAGIDDALLGAARLLVDYTVMPPPDQVDSLRRSAAFYRSPELVAEPRRLFAFLDEALALPQPEVERLRASTPARERSAVRFASTYRPANPAQQAAYDAEIANHTVHVELWRHGGAAARGTIVALHGFGMGNPRIDATALMASELFDMGFHVALLTLPFHGKRKSGLVSGRLFASPDVAQLTEAVVQSVHDVVRAVDWLRAELGGPVGLLGLSLGGYVTALTAGLVERLDFAVPMVAPVCFGDLAYRFMTASRRYRDARGSRLEYEEFRDLYRVHSPLTHALRLRHDRVLIVAGRGDRIVPTEHPNWLWAHWDRPRIHWLAGGHIAPFGRRHAVGVLREFFVDVLE
jgi:pimeloyl-ACP methyl ester carboxylesterase